MSSASPGLRRLSRGDSRGPPARKVVAVGTAGRDTYLLRYNGRGANFEADVALYAVPGAALLPPTATMREEKVAPLDQRESKRLESSHLSPV
ncbi:hypothetical protein MTO96_035940 [Rhipicephalus appendiculatus]